MDFPPKVLRCDGGNSETDATPEGSTDLFDFCLDADGLDAACASKIWCRGKRGRCDGGNSETDATPEGSTGLFDADGLTTGADVNFTAFLGLGLFDIDAAYISCDLCAMSAAYASFSAAVNVFFREFRIFFKYFDFLH